MEFNKIKREFQDYQAKYWVPHMDASSDRGRRKIKDIL